MKSTKFIAVLTLLFFWALMLTAQSSVYNFHRNQTVVIELPYQPTQKITLPIKGIEIIDARFDQTKIGTNTITNGLEIKRQDLIFLNDLPDELQSAFTNWFEYDPQSKFTLLLVIKNFRLSENIINYVLHNLRKEYFLQIACAAYLQQENKCYKSSLVNKWYSSNTRINDARICKEEHENFITNILLSEISQLHFNIDSNASVYERKEIDDAVAARFNIPALHEKTGTGIFKTFEDFIANKSQPVSFQRVTDKKGRVSLFDEKGKIINSKNAYAMYNGQQLFYFAGDYYYEMKRRGNFYEVKTYYETENNSIVSMMDDLYSRAYFPNNVRRAFRDKQLPEYIEIDMDTGDLYLEELSGINRPKELLQ